MGAPPRQGGHHPSLRENSRSVSQDLASPTKMEQPVTGWMARAGAAFNSTGTRGILTLKCVGF